MTNELRFFLIKFFGKMGFGKYKNSGFFIFANISS